MSGTMIVKQTLKCDVHMPNRLHSRFNGEQEIAQGLPPYANVEVYPVDEYPACPANWEHGSDIASSYFMGVKKNKGLWFNLNDCHEHTHDVAVVISVQGINPVTGQKMVGKEGLKLEQYHKKCPIHDVKFQQDRYCPKCKFKWPGQNYLSTTGTPLGYLWLDGFRGEDGTVRQYIFTLEKMKGIAAQLIGEDRVFAVGIAFYLSKKKKPEVPKSTSRIADESYLKIAASHHIQPMWVNHTYTSDPWDTSSLSSKSPSTDKKTMANFRGAAAASGLYQVDAMSMNTSTSNRGTLGTNDVPSGEIRLYDSVDMEPMQSQKVEAVVPTKNFEVGAGALIDQKVYDDPKPMDYWEEEPAGMIFLNYCDEKTKKKILDAGKRADEKEGFMQGLIVGG